MASMVDKFKADLEKLILLGDNLQNRMAHELDRKGFDAAMKQVAAPNQKKVLDVISKLDFAKDYQRWYSESLAVLRQLLPDRCGDFIRLFEKPKAVRKSISFENYRIEDCLQGLRITYGGEIKVGPTAAFPLFQQQRAILEAASARFESSLFDIKHLVQADLLDSEIEVAETLLKHRFTRASGAVGGVVLERHLGQVCTDRNCRPSKKNPTISDFNEALKEAAIIDIPNWRFIQHLGDIRNLCDHSKEPEPTKEQVADLLAGVKRVIKSVF